ncbi:MAG: lipid IV(A) 3-deoxy-D-manno-octulosonic acid transferase [Desulfohalobiaceae bacterium]|nr:lipid IV(A) 3-deoxy-D-manno-octulosonic acid transferase [Desulfohalobiaceae bacterium]
MNTDRILHGTYNTLISGLSPLIFGRLLLKGLQSPGYKHRWSERLGHAPFRSEGRTIWVHAVSVGEVQAAIPLLKQLRQRHPEREILVTTTTPTGSQQLRDQLGDSVRHCYAPYDFPFAVPRFLDAARPDLAVIMETEIWPNIFRECSRRDIPLFLANARISPSSFRRYRAIRGFLSGLLREVTVLAQSRDDADRFTALGAPPERTHVCGNIKFDIQLPRELVDRGSQLGDRLSGGERLVWIGASTHQGEEEHLLRAHAALAQRCPGAVLLLVPRHPERFEHVAGLCRRHGFSLHRRSQGLFPDQPCSVYLGDSMGELPLYYAASDIAFVGGSLVQTGGHNLLEPAALCRPILTGPHVFNFTRISELLLQRRGLLQLSDPGQLDESLCRLALDPELRADMGSRASEVVQENQGAAQAILAQLETALPPRS